MFLRRLFATRPPPFQFSADLPDDEPMRLHDVLNDCLSGKGGMIAAARRTNALAGLFTKLSPTGKARFTAAIESLDGDAVATAMNSYSDIEEAELFGRARDRMAIFDALERRRLRLLTMLAETPDGPQILAEMASLDPRLTDDINTARAGFD